MNLVKLTELDDYLTPALDCVVMANEAAAKSKEAVKTLSGSSKTKLMLEDDDFTEPKAIPIKPRLIKQNPGEDKASVNLYDCLACSGCVTSSEVVLLELLTNLEKSKFAVALISPQSRDSLAIQLGIDPRKVMQRIVGHFRKLGIQLVLGLEYFIDLQQALHAKEQDSTTQKPLILSECPGWICYLEKVVKDPLINLASRVKTPQLLAGHLLKNLISEGGINKADIMTVSVAPCHDKKLETFRPESVVEEVPIGTEGTGPKSLDVVLTTSEILDLLVQEPEEMTPNICYSGDVLMAEISQNSHAQPGYFEKFNLRGYNPTEHPIFMPSMFASLNSSNNFLGQIFLRRAYAKSGRLPEESAFKESLRRNKKGFVEVTFEDVASQTKLFGARVYGFKNIQNMIRNLKSPGADKCYDYVEVLACPGGCYSGGGQLKEKDTNPAATEKAFDSLHLVRSGDHEPRAADTSKMVDESEEVMKLHQQGTAPTFRRYFFQNANACELAETILANKCRWMKREDVEYKIKALQTDNPLTMKW